MLGQPLASVGQFVQSVADTNLLFLLFVFCVCVFRVLEWLCSFWAGGGGGRRRHPT